jgi:hypothetical protein
MVVGLFLVSSAATLVVRIFKILFHLLQHPDNRLLRLQLLLQWNNSLRLNSAIR